MRALDIATKLNLTCHLLLAICEWSVAIGAVAYIVEDAGVRTRRGRLGLIWCNRALILLVGTAR